MGLKEGSGPRCLLKGRLRRESGMDVATGISVRGTVVLLCSTCFNNHVRADYQGEREIQ